MPTPKAKQHSLKQTLILALLAFFWTFFIHAAVLHLCELLSIFKFLIFHFITYFYASKTVDRLLKAYVFNTFYQRTLYSLLLYGSISQGPGTTKFMNLIGWNWYWQRSRFSNLWLYIRWEIHFIQDHTQTISTFCYGRTQHVRRMCF